jgi:hypothetical protein
MKILRISVLFIALGLLVASCEKKEQPITLPEKGKAEVARVDMGEDYTDQIFFDLETNSIVTTSVASSWDLAFEAGAVGSHIFLNGSNDIFVYNTHTSDINNVTLPANLTDKDWAMDSPHGEPSATAIGECFNTSGISKNEVYIVKLNPTLFPDTFKKIMLVSVDPGKYVMMYGDLKGGEVKNITITKDDNYNFTYFSFNEGGNVVHPEPPKNTWDIVFTRYRHIYVDLDNFPYLVSGVLLNPYNTTAHKDTTAGYQKLDINTISHVNLSAQRDIIGFDWKIYDFDKSRYSIDPEKAYIIKTRKNQYWKLHFLDFYSDKGVKGSPSFEFERLQ